MSDGVSTLYKKDIYGGIWWPLIGSGSLRRAQPVCDKTGKRKIQNGARFTPIDSLAQLLSRWSCPQLQLLESQSIGPPADRSVQFTNQLRRKCVQVFSADNHSPKRHKQLHAEALCGLRP